jgi:hypothetical protein
MHEQICTKFKAYEQMRMKIITQNQIKKTMIRQKQSLVYKVPSGVVILSHVCGVAAIVLPSSIVWVYLENMVRQGILCLLAVKNGMGVAT